MPALVGLGQPRLQLPLLDLTQLICAPHLTHFDAPCNGSCVRSPELNLSNEEPRLTEKELDILNLIQIGSLGRLALPECRGPARQQKPPRLTLPTSASRWLSVKTILKLTRLVVRYNPVNFGPKHDSVSPNVVAACGEEAAFQNHHRRFRIQNHPFLKVNTTL